MAWELLIVAIGCVAVAGINAYARTVEARTVRQLAATERTLEDLALEVESAIATLRAERKALDSWRTEADSRLISLERRVEGLGLKMSGR